MGAWSMIEDVSLCEAWVQGNWFYTYEMALSSRWKVLNKELGKWRNALAKAIDNQRSGENLSNEIIQAQMWFGATGQGKKSFNHTHCWEVVKTCKRFQIIPTGPTVVLNETPLHETPASDSPMDSPMSTDSPIENIPRPIGRKAAKAKRGSNSARMQRSFGGTFKAPSHEN
ncbi:Nucleotide-diphospho-sugar transferases superfamily protein [Prunus dulcis]|uniref:Nucleotide-diphospho-sugar transferases superfamily protein n=1 Tax=Prunus dulcis TaxID=3755 RepID=A0A4Y1S269_PRUDU|nr:Nucleotide-diphospho-sugar transferases superfamily protein [Prunus dulcis]